MRLLNIHHIPHLPNRHLDLSLPRQLKHLLPLRHIRTLLPINVIKRRTPPTKQPGRILRQPQNNPVAFFDNNLAMPAIIAAVEIGFSSPGRVGFC